MPTNHCQPNFMPELEGLYRPQPDAHSGFFPLQRT
jgi:hypothetical protein